MLSFCTLFDSKYLSRGLALYESLMAHCPNAHLYIFAFDKICYRVLDELRLSNATIIGLEELEASEKELLQVKPTRTVGEYCWTSTPAIILYSIKKFHLDMCTYLDADLYFFSSPKVLIDELGSKSVLITAHRYTSEYNQENTSGKYCVQFMTFKNDKNGMKTLNWWREACIKWCCARVEDGKFGDQKYLDDWMVRFDGIHELEHLGGGVAPWNVQQYEFCDKNNAIVGQDLLSGKLFDLVFYHFHSLKFFPREKVSFGGYFLSRGTIQYIYSPYLRHLERLREKLENIDLSLDSHGRSAFSYKVGVRSRIRQNIDFIKNAILLLIKHPRAKKYILRKPNVFSVKKIVELTGHRLLWHT